MMLKYKLGKILASLMWYLYKRSFFTTGWAISTMSGGQASAVYVTISDSSDEEPQSSASQLTLKRRLKREFPHLPEYWEVSNPADVRKFKDICIYSRQLGTDPKHEKEVAEVVNKIDHAWSATLPAYRRFFTIASITRIQNYRDVELYAAALKAVEADMTGISNPIFDGNAYHGTHMKHAEDIAKHGLISSRNAVSLYGKGFYTSFECLTHPPAYASKSVNGLAPAIVMGRAIHGKRSATPSPQDIPNEGDHSGGNGANDIHVLFKEHHFLAQYYISISIPATEEEWRKQSEILRQVQGEAAKPPPPAKISPPDQVASQGSAAAGPSMIPGGAQPQAVPAIMPAPTAAMPPAGVPAPTPRSKISRVNDPGGSAAAAAIVPAAGGSAAAVVVAPTPAIEAKGPSGAGPAAAKPAVGGSAAAPANVPAAPTAAIKAKGAAPPSSAAKPAAPAAKPAMGGSAAPPPSSAAKGKGRAMSLPKKTKRPRVSSKEGCSSSGHTQYKPDPRPSDDSSPPSDEDDEDYKP